MSNVFSTRTQNVFPCDQPVLTVGFPTAAAPGTTVTLANGAVVDLVQLGKLIAQFCPAVAAAAAPTTVQQAAAPTAVLPTATQNVPAVVGSANAPITTFGMQTCPNLVTQPVTPMCGMAQQTVNPMLMNAIGQLAAQVAFRNMFDLRDGPGPDQMMLAALMGL